MNKQQLASLIWDTCNDLRGSISAVEYKDIILGFIFYRFVSENEVADLLEQGVNKESCQLLMGRITETYREMAESSGKALIKA